MFDRPEVLKNARPGWWKEKEYGISHIRFADRLKRMIKRIMGRL